MGLVAKNPAVHLAIQTTSLQLLPALSLTEQRVASGEADAAIARWFGNDALTQKKELGVTLRSFKSNINLRKIIVGFDEVKVNPAFNKADFAAFRTAQAAAKANPALPIPAAPAPMLIRSQGLNAAAFAAKNPDDLRNLGKGLAHVPGNEDPVILGESFKRLPIYLKLTADGRVDSSFYSQSQFETLVHELSHLLLGSQDVKFDDGSTAYGAENAELLATFGSEHAFTNAENWGIFVEAVGIHKSS
jgi:hypothetical protein